MGKYLDEQQRRETEYRARIAKEREHLAKLRARPTFTRTCTDPIRAITTNKIHRLCCTRLRYTPDDQLDDDLQAATDICQSCYSSPRSEQQRIQAIIDKQLRAEAKARDRTHNRRAREQRTQRLREPGLVVTAGYGSGLSVGWSPDGMKIAARLSQDHDSNWLEAAIKAWET